MQKINQIFGKEVINQTSGEKIATVQDVVLDNDTRHIVALIIRSAGLMGNSSVVRWSSVVSVGDVVVAQVDPPLPSVKDDAEVAELVKQSYRITGTSVISDKGEQLGTVGDIFVNDRGEIVGYEVKTGMLHSNKYLPAEHVQVAGKDAVISRLSDLPRMKDVGNGQEASDTSEAVATPSIATLGADQAATSDASYTEAPTDVYAYNADEPVASSTDPDSYTYNADEPDMLGTDTDDTTPAYSADALDEPAAISTDSADTVAADTSVYSTDTSDEPAAISTDDMTPADSFDVSDEPVAFGTDSTATYDPQLADEPVVSDANEDVAAYDSGEPKEHAVSSDATTDPYANKAKDV